MEEISPSFPCWDEDFVRSRREGDISEVTSLAAMSMARVSALVAALTRDVIFPVRSMMSSETPRLSWTATTKPSVPYGMPEAGRHRCWPTMKLSQRVRSSFPAALPHFSGSPPPAELTPAAAATPSASSWPSAYTGRE